MKLCDDDEQWNCAVAIANTRQNFEHMKSVFTMTQAVPTLMKNSCLIDMVRNRILFTPEYWAIQGFPHPSIPASGRASMHFHAPSLVRAPGGSGSPKLCYQDQRALVGNSMHWAQVGVMCSYSCARAVCRVCCSASSASVSAA